nr:deoxyribodipyrimidine photo-lyase [Actinomycetota bacterium]
MQIAIVLFTRDLRVHDQPALAAAVETAEHVVPLFVFDPGVLERFGVPNRAAFLLDALRNLARSLRERGGGLVVREGEVVVETMRIAAETGAAAIFVSEDVSAYAQAREQRLRHACEEQRIELRVLPGITVVPPGDLAPAGADHYRVFTPYWRQWRSTPRRRLEPAPSKIVLPSGLRKGRLPALVDLAPGPRSTDLPRGGESEGRRRLVGFLENGVSEYGRLHDDLPADATSRLSPYLHFGCLSALEIAERAGRRAGSGSFVRQLCWRDFYTQLLAARPETSRDDYRDRSDRWRDDEAALVAWKAGRTGYPIVDAGMRQLSREGYMHNRARLLVASFLTKDLYLDWRLGAAHF